MPNNGLTYCKARLAKCLLAFSLVLSFFIAVAPAGHSPIQLQKAITEVVLVNGTPVAGRQINYQQQQVFKPAVYRLLPLFNIYNAICYNQQVKVKLNRLQALPIPFNSTFQAFYLHITSPCYNADLHFSFIG
jgi:hypothetical protein